MNSPRLRRLAVLLVIAAIAVSCKDTQAPPAETPADAAANDWTASSTDLTFKTETADGRASSIVLLARDIVYAPDSGILSASVALHNTGQDVLVGPTSVEVFDFAPEDIVPLNAVCGIVPGSCWFEYDGAYGADGMLSPGETSTARVWQIHNERGVGFRFRCRLMPPPQIGGRIAGVVFEDLDRNGERDPNERGIAGVTISIKRPDVIWINRTNDRGNFEFRVQEPGVYTLAKPASNACEPTTADEMSVVVFRDANGNLTDFLNADFGCYPRVPPQPGVAGRVFLDSNRNGTPDPNEGGIVTTISVMRFPPDSPGARCFVSPLVVETDGNGRFFIAPGDFPCDPPWLIQRGPNSLHENSNGLFGTTPRDFVYYNRSVPPIDMPVDFGLAPYDSSQQVVLVVEGLVFIDANENGIRDANEGPASGVRLSLLSPCDRLETSWTNGDGYYRFEPPNTDWCEIGGVGVGNGPDAATTTNPVLFPPPVVPGIHSVRADFGVRPQVLPQ